MLGYSRTRYFQYTDYARQNRTYPNIPNSKVTAAPPVPFVRIWGEMFDHSFILRRAFYFHFLKWKSALAHKVPSLCQYQSIVAQRIETTVAECSLTSCVRARFRKASHTMPGQRRSQPTPISLGSGPHACLGVTYHLHFWHNDRGLLRATAVTRDGTDTE